MLELVNKISTQVANLLELIGNLIIVIDSTIFL
jgi:hypothetical protein